MALSLAKAALAYALLAPPQADGSECHHHRHRSCPAGLTGPTCDIPCPGPDPCDYALQCESNGDTAGLSLLGAPLFDVRPDWPEWLVRLAFIRFIVDHPGALGLAPGLAPADLDLAPAHAFAVDAGRLRLLRFRQQYRGLPVYGRDITLIAGASGVTGIRGAIVDGRDEYAYFTAPAPAAAGEASILAHAAARARLPASALRVAGLRLVAFPRARALGWSGAVMHGPALLADVVVAADPSAASPALLHHVAREGRGLADEVAIVARAEDMASPIFAPPIETANVMTLPDGAALTGTTAGPLTRLADPRVVLLDAAGATSRTEALLSPIYGATGPFDAEPGTREFVFQSTYVWLQSFYAKTDALMHGRWDSLLPSLGAGSLVPPGEFSPRLVATLDSATVLCEGQGNHCVSSAWALDDTAPEALQHPSPAPPHEPVGTLFLRGTIAPSVLPHEFGHFVDLFTGPGFIYEPFACGPACWSTCKPGTTDESVPLTETFANLMAMWYYTELFAEAGQSTNCETLARVSTGLNRMPHSDTCRPDGDAISYFLPWNDPECVSGQENPNCDRPKANDTDILDGIGLCSRKPGYAVDSYHQAFWELLHAESCSPVAPYVCTPLTALAGLPASRAVGEALLFAAQVNSGTYDGFAADIATYFACTYGQAAYEEVREVLCHHRIYPCDAPAPALCDFCGDGVRTGYEACDGGDLGGLGCEDFGLVSGALACDPACIFDLTGCQPPTPDSVDGPTSTAGTGTGPNPSLTTSSASGEPPPAPGGLFIDVGPSAADEPGCGCRHDDPPVGPTLLTLLALHLGRRRRPREPATPPPSLPSAARL